MTMTGGYQYRYSGIVSGNRTFLDREKIESSITSRIRSCLMEGFLLGVSATFGANSTFFFFAWSNIIAI